MSNDFIQEYMLKCFSGGVVSPNDICNKALEEIDELDRKLAEANEYRLKRKNLVSVLKNFDHESLKKYKKNTTQIDMNNLIDSDNTEYKSFLLQICNLFQSTDQSISKREVMDHMGGLEQNQLVYMGIKWLCDNGILVTNDDRSLSRGENWSIHLSLLDVQKAV